MTHLRVLDERELNLIGNIQASYFGDYGGGVYEDSRCCEADSDPNCIWTLNHEVTVIGKKRNGFSV